MPSSLALGGSSTRALPRPRFVTSGTISQAFNLDQTNCHPLGPNLRPSVRRFPTSPAKARHPCLSYQNEPPIEDRKARVLTMQEDATDSSARSRVSRLLT